MRRFWLKARLPLSIFGLLVLTIAFARLFSGPEDTWIKNEQGEWVAHGHPSGPKPSVDYVEPVSYSVIPLAFFAAFVVPLLLLKTFRYRPRLTYETVIRDSRLYGYLGLSLILFGVLSGMGLMWEIARGGGDPDVATLLFIQCFAGLSALCIITGAAMLCMKRIISDHYQLEKGRREVIEKLDELLLK